MTGNMSLKTVPLGPTSLTENSAMHPHLSASAPVACVIESITPTVGSLRESGGVGAEGCLGGRGVRVIEGGLADELEAVLVRVERDLERGRILGVGDRTFL